MPLACPPFVVLRCIALQSAYSAIEEQLGEVEKYVQTWLQYQSLWDMQMSAVSDKLAGSLDQVGYGIAQYGIA